MNKLIGKKYGRLTVIEFVETKGKGHKYYLCQCECGNQKIIGSYDLTSGKTSNQKHRMGVLK